MKSKFSKFIILDWQENPTLTILETTKFPIEEVDFPTITLCPENINSDRMRPTMKVLDHLKLACKNGK